MAYQKRSILDAVPLVEAGTDVIGTDEAKPLRPYGTRLGLHGGQQRGHGCRVTSHLGQPLDAAEAIGNRLRLLRSRQAVELADEVAQ